MLTNMDDLPMHCSQLLRFAQSIVLNWRKIAVFYFISDSMSSRFLTNCKRVHFKNGLTFQKFHQYPITSGTLQSIFTRLGTKWTYHIDESLFKPTKHLNISATFYLVGSALCIVVLHLNSCFLNTCVRKRNLHLLFQKSNEYNSKYIPKKVLTLN